MEIKAVLDLLARERGVHQDESTWRRIDQWHDWWLGEHKPFHRYRERDSAGGVMERPIYSMRMAKKVCEDWAAILLGETPQLIVEHEPSGRYLFGSGGTGALDACRFWQRAAALVEMAFYSGTGVMVLRLQNVHTDAGGHILPGSGTPRVQCLPAMNLIPLTVRDGEITEAAFCSEVLDRGRPVIYLETHTLEENGYVIENRCFERRSGALHEREMPDGVARRFDSRAVTATQYIGDRQELVRNAARHGVLLCEALQNAARMLLWAGRAVCGEDVDETCRISVKLDDSVITEREAQRENDRADVAAGLMLPHEYRMRWYGETEDAARDALRTSAEKER